MTNINDYDIVADLYDIYVPVTYDLDFFINECNKHPGEVLELMSGTGRVSIPLLQAGVKLTCVDSSAKSNLILNDKLKQMGLKADIFQMDIRELDLPYQYGLIIIPFHSFAHIVTTADQRLTLERIRKQLLLGGTFICTLVNPIIRQATVDGRLRLVRKYSMPDQKGDLHLWVVENADPEDPHIVHALQFYEEYDPNGVLQLKRCLELHFRLSRKDEFEELAREAGFKIKALYGDYSYARFDKKNSPFMIWSLEGAAEMDQAGPKNRQTRGGGD